MPRQIPNTATPDEMEKEIDATEVALEVDENAASFKTATRGWDEGIPELRIGIRENNKRLLRLQMMRQTINRYLDPMCTDFARDLLHDVKDDREHPRWKQHFKMAPSEFIDQRFEDQVHDVKAWLVLDDPALASHKAGLLKWVLAAEALFAAEALDAKASEAVRAAIEAFAESLTIRRDELHRMLADHAVKHGLPRDWADGFFLRGR